MEFRIASKAAASEVHRCAGRHSVPCISRVKRVTSRLVRHAKCERKPKFATRLFVDTKRKLHILYVLQAISRCVKQCSNCTYAKALTHNVFYKTKLV
jgi:hypothetical protein